MHFVLDIVVVLEGGLLGVYLFQFLGGGGGGIKYQITSGMQGVDNSERYLSFLFLYFFYPARHSILPQVKPIFPTITASSAITLYRINISIRGRRPQMLSAGPGWE